MNELATATHHHDMASMMWLPMHGETWLDAATSFLAMWTPMMAAMMAPVVAPTLWRYGQALNGARVRRAAMVSAAGAAYLLVWAALGLVVFPIGAAVAALAGRLAPPSQLVSIATGAVVLLAGALQFTAWKTRVLACCRDTPIGCVMRASMGNAWRHGVRLGLHCTYCCAGFTAVLLVIGMMDVRAMLLGTAAIVAERLAPRGERAAKAVGALVMVASSYFFFAAATGGA